MDIELMTDPYACMMYIVSQPGRGHIVAASRLTACFSLLLCCGSFLRIEKYIYYVWVGGEVIISF